MQQAHFLFLMVARQRLDQRADQHLQQAAAHGAKECGDQQRRIGRDYFGQEAETDQTEPRKRVGGDHADAVAQLIDKLGGERINRHLNGEIDGDNQADLRKRDGEAALEGEKQQRRKVVDDGLHNVGYEARKARVAIGVLHGGNYSLVSLIVL